MTASGGFRMPVLNYLIKLLNLLDMKNLGYFFAAAAFCLAALGCPAGAAEVSFSGTVAAESFKTPKTPKGEVRTVVFKSNMHCQKCADKVNGNIAFEKGVKDLKVDVKNDTITIKYDPAKTSVEKLAAAIVKLGYTAEVVKD